MRGRPAVPLAAALMVLAGSGPAAGQNDGCVILPDRGPGSSGPHKLADVIPLAQGQWLGDVYVLPFEYPETYDRYLPGQVDNVAARQWVARSFLEHNPDAYDFLAVATTFPFDAGWGPYGDPTHGLYWAIRNDTSGIGLPLFDVAQDYGSSRLQGYIDVNDLELVRDPQGVLDAKRFQVVLNHELGHRWLAFCRYDAGSGPPSDGLLGVDDSHWSYLLDSDGSFMYGSRWRDNGDGTFTATEVRQRYSELDLYLMGMLGADEVAPFELLESPAVAPDQYPELGATVTATPTTVAIDQVIAAEGARLPAAAEAPRELRAAMVLLVAPGTQPTAEQLGFLDDARRSWSRSFFARTGGRGVLGVGRNSIPVSSPSSVDLAGAVAWLLAQRSPSGTWSDGTPTRGRDTAAAVDALDRFGGHDGTVASALDAVTASAGLTTEVEAWRAELLARHQHPAAGALLDQLASWVLEEGAWGGGLRHAGDAVTTARVARALAAGGRTAAATDAVAWVTARHNADGGWSWRDGGSSATAPTLEAVAAEL
ncbi:MAG TPA: hypothetical protein VLT32_15625, partial [Candidatus Sulfomarinibacteraceae bacterium]|nr:hypothetical protein [Candidatus Sulfomarinibacteraceae bacterium]